MLVAHLSNGNRHLFGTNIGVTWPKCVLLGDKWQMTGFVGPFDLQGATAHAFSLQRSRFLEDPGRSTDEPSRQEALEDPWVQEALARQSAPPMAEELRKPLKSRPNTTIPTISRYGTKLINDAALEGLVLRYPPKVVIDADMESNPDTYVRTERKPVEELEPMKMPVYIGMQVYLTRNGRKDVAFVNGMKCEARKRWFVIKIFFVSIAFSFCWTPGPRSLVGTPRTRACTWRRRPAIGWQWGLGRTRPWASMSITACAQDMLRRRGTFKAPSCPMSRSTWTRLAYLLQPTQGYRELPPAKIGFWHAMGPWRPITMCQLGNETGSNFEGGWPALPCTYRAA